MDGSAVLLESLRVAWERLVMALPRVAGGALVVLIGWLFAVVVRGALVGVLSALRFNRLAERSGLTEALRRGAIQHTVVELLGEVAYWLVFAAALILAMQFVGLPAAAVWLERFGYFVPRLVISIAIFLFGALLAGFLGTTARVASLNAGLPQGYVLGQVVSTTVILVTTIVALEQLDVATRTIEVALYIILASLGLGFALALGLGGQEFVRRYLNELWERWKTPPKA